MISRDILRLILLLCLMYFLISDLIELYSYLPATSFSLTPHLHRILNIKFGMHKVKSADRDIQKKQINAQNPQSLKVSSRKFHLDPKNSNPEGTERRRIVSSWVKDRQTGTGFSQSQHRSLTPHEEEGLEKLKEAWIQVMQNHCLPKLVCELHATLTGETVLTQGEKGLLETIKDTAFSSYGMAFSQYLFAAHMGQLLVGIEGNGCHNFYPSCPLSGKRVLRMIKKAI